MKCFLIKIVILANHQEGKDSHIRAIRCFGKKPNVSGIGGSNMGSNDLQYNIGNNDSLHHSELLRDLSLATGGVGSSNMSGLLLNNRTILGITDRGNILEEEGGEEEGEEEGQNGIDDTDYRQSEEGTSGASTEETQKIINNVSSIIGFNSGFQSLELKSISSIR